MAWGFTCRRLTRIAFGRAKEMSFIEVFNDLPWNKSQHEIGRYCDKYSSYQVNEAVAHLCMRIGQMCQLVHWALQEARG